MTHAPDLHRDPDELAMAGRAHARGLARAVRRAVHRIALAFERNLAEDLRELLDVDRDELPPFAAALLANPDAAGDTAPDTIELRAIEQAAAWARRRRQQSEDARLAAQARARVEATRTVPEQGVAPTAAATTPADAMAALKAFAARGMQQLRAPPPTPAPYFPGMPLDGMMLVIGPTRGPDGGPLR